MDETTKLFSQSVASNFNSVNLNFTAVNDVLANHKTNIMNNTININKLGWIVGIGFTLCYFSIRDLKRQIKQSQNTVINNVTSPVEEEA